jgi:hypothetical protein
MSTKSGRRNCLYCIDGLLLCSNDVLQHAGKNNKGSWAGIAALYVKHMIGR